MTTPSSLEVLMFTEQTAKLAASAWSVQWFAQDKEILCEAVLIPESEGDRWVVRVAPRIEGQRIPLDISAANTSGHSVYLAVQAMRQSYVAGFRAGELAHKSRLIDLIHRI